MALPPISTFFTRSVAIDRNLKRKNSSSSSNLPLKRIKNTEEYNSAFDASSIKKIPNDSRNEIEQQISKQSVQLWSDEEEKEILEICSGTLNFTNHPILLSELSNSGIYSFHQGTNRLVYINKITGHGYKIFKASSGLKNCKDSLFYDMRINDIYRDQNFYGGKYAKFANNNHIQIIDDYTKPLSYRYVYLYTFKVIPNSEPLYWNSKIPASALKMMEDIGYLPFDVKPQNFRKIKNEQGGYDYLPTDAKFIGRKRSKSPRTLAVIDFKKKFGEYYYEAQYIDNDK